MFNLKRIFDIILSSIGIVLSSPLWLVIAIAIKLEDGGEVFYSQDRAGKDSIIFKGMKFRSMIVDAEKYFGPLQAQDHDQRVTRIGRLLRNTAMDELPQLINILKGDMSFVGPRALPPVEIEAGDSQPKSVWEFKGFKERSGITPGLTGIAQILAPRDIPRSEKFKYDIWYVKNQSFLLDIYLIFLSFLVTFMGKWETREDRLAFLLKGLKKKVESHIK